MSSKANIPDQATRWIVAPAKSAFDEIRDAAVLVFSAVDLLARLLAWFILSYVVALLVRINVVNRHTVGRLLEHNNQEKLVSWIAKGWVNSHTPLYVFESSTSCQSGLLLPSALLRARSQVVIALLDRLTPEEISSLEFEPALLERMTKEDILSLDLVPSDFYGKKKKMSLLDLLYLGFGYKIVEFGHCPNGGVANGRISEAQAWQQWLNLRTPLQDALLERGIPLAPVFEKKGTAKHRELFLMGQAKLLSMATQKCDASTVSRTRL